MGDTAFLGRARLAASPGASLRLIRDYREIERLIATIDVAEMTGAAKREAEEDCSEACPPKRKANEVVARMSQRVARMRPATSAIALAQ
jgi:type II secretory pathway component PulL